LALFFNYPHYMATIYRAYHRAEDFQKYRIFTVHTTALIVFTLFLSHFWLRLLPWIFTIYLTWSPWHYSGQNYGLFMMFARRAGANPGKAERRALYGAFVASYLILFLGFHSGVSSDPLFVSLGIPPAIARWEQVALSVVFLGLAVFGLSRVARDTGWRKLLPSLTLFSSQFLWFLLPTAISLIKGLEIPQSRYSSGVLAVMHSAQYLWITSYYARREASEGSRRNWRPMAYCAVLVAGGIALFVPGPWLASRVFHHDFTASFLIFTALVNIHHFILDGAIWKLRDGRIANLLLNSRERMSGAATEAGGRLAGTWRWMAGSAPSARLFRVAAMLLLLVWGSVDQLRYYLALRTDSLRDLRRAASLDSFDSTLQMRLAHGEIDAGNPQAAESAWRKAIQANPSDPASRHALLRFLIDQSRFDEAFDVTEASLKYSPKDSKMLVDRGLLALRRGHADEAIASWDQATVADPEEVMAHLYLAHELDREGKPQPAAVHYSAFLGKISRPASSALARPEPDKVIAIILRMADCQARSFQNEQAVRSYQLAEKLASQTRQPKLESVADINEAALQAKTGKLGEALRLYQQALKLDDSIADRRSSAKDWFIYGHFLDDAGFPARLVYACYARAFSLAEPDVSFQKSTTAAMKEVGTRVGPEPAAIRRSPESAAREALRLRR
jgi:tetratricopeptide (TPR) repeat protein